MVDSWFLNPFMGSKVPITYEYEFKYVNPFTGFEETVLEREIVGYVFVDDLQRFMNDMDKIQSEVSV